MGVGLVVNLGMAVDDGAGDGIDVVVVLHAIGLEVHVVVNDGVIKVELAVKVVHVARSKASIGKSDVRGLLVANVGVSRIAGGGGSLGRLRGGLRLGLLGGGLRGCLGLSCGCLRLGLVRASALAAKSVATFFEFSMTFPFPAPGCLRQEPLLFLSAFLY